MNSTRLFLKLKNIQERNLIKIIGEMFFIVVVLYTFNEMNIPIRVFLSNKISFIIDSSILYNLCINEILVLNKNRISIQ